MFLLRLTLLLNIKLTGKYLPLLLIKPTIDLWVAWVCNTNVRYDELFLETIFHQSSKECCSDAAINTNLTLSHLSICKCTSSAITLRILWQSDVIDGAFSVYCVGIYLNRTYRVKLSSFIHLSLKLRLFGSFIK